MRHESRCVLLSVLAVPGVAVLGTSPFRGAEPQLTQVSASGGAASSWQSLEPLELQWRRSRGADWKDGVASLNEHDEYAVFRALADDTHEGCYVRLVATLHFDEPWFTPGYLPNELDHFQDARLQKQAGVDLHQMSGGFWDPEEKMPPCVLPQSALEEMIVDAGVDLTGTPAVVDSERVKDAWIPVLPVGGQVTSREWLLHHPRWSSATQTYWNSVRNDQISENIITTWGWVERCMHDQTNGDLDAGELVHWDEFPFKAAGLMHLEIQMLMIWADATATGYYPPTEPYPEASGLVGDWAAVGTSTPTGLTYSGSHGAGWSNKHWYDVAGAPNVHQAFLTCGDQFNFKMIHNFADTYAVFRVSPGPMSMAVLPVFPRAGIMGAYVNVPCGVAAGTRFTLQRYQIGGQLFASLPPPHRPFFVVQ
ncbi:MAG: hypothetical protein AAF628_18015 [Planctomycetota bacterium]